MNGQAVTNTKSKESEAFLDITSEVCPLTFVKTKLAIEKLQPGKLLRIKLKGREPLENVPRSVIDHGHRVLSIQSEEKEHNNHGIHYILIQKA